MQPTEETLTSAAPASSWEPPAEGEVERRRERMQRRVDILRAEYREDRRSYDAIEHKQAEHFSKAMLTVSVAALGFSLSYAQWIGEEAVLTGALAGSWASFAFTSLIVILSFYKSNYAFRLAKQFADAKHDFEVQECVDKLERFRYGKIGDANKCANLGKRKDELRKLVEDESGLVGILNLTSLYAFLAGLVLFLMFAYENLPS